MSDNGVLAAIWLAKSGSIGLDGVFQGRRIAQVVLSLAYNVAKFLEEVLQLLLLSGRQVRRDGRQGGEAVGRGRTSAMATTSKVPTVCLVCRWSGSGRWLWIAAHTSDPLVSAGTPDTNVAGLLLGKSRHPHLVMGYGNGPGSLSQLGS